MFEFIAAADRSARPRAALPLVASLIIHAAILAALFTLSFPDEIAVATPSRIRAMTLLEPVPAAVRAAAPAAEFAREHSTSAPANTSPVSACHHAAAIPAPHGELWCPPAIDIPRPVLPVLELAHIAAAPPPPLKTDNLAAPWVAAPPAAPSAVVQPAGFAAATSAATRVLGSLLPTGFENASTAMTRHCAGPCRRFRARDSETPSFASAAGDPARMAL